MYSGGEVVKKLLITGFDPFGGETVNPSWEAVKGLSDVVGEYALTKLQIPTVFIKAAETVLSAAEILQPDVILCIGQAGGRSTVTPEVVAINLREARIPDNEGNQPVNTQVSPEGPAAYFTTVPVREMVAALQDAGIPGSLSFSAGAFVCNDVLYTLLHRYHGTQTRVGFIHVPHLPQQAKPDGPSLPLNTMTAALETAIKALG
jgi:pyroglutamyl-peptidase